MCCRLLLFALALSACGTQSSVMIMGLPRAPRPDNCPLELVTPDRLTKDGVLSPEYEQIGVINIEARTGATPTDPEVKKELRARACNLGGEYLVMGSSSESRSQTGVKLGQNLSFMVFSRKAETSSIKY